MAARGVRSSWLASAAKRRSRDSLAARRRSAVSTCPSIWLNASPTWPVSVLGSVSGTPAGSDTSPDSRGSSATWDGGGGHPAQRAEREPDPERAEHPGEQQDRAEHGGLGERDVPERVVQAGQRQARDVDGAVAVRVVNRGELVHALGPVEVVRRAGDVRAGAASVLGERGLRRDAEQRLLVGGARRDRALADEPGNATGRARRRRRMSSRRARGSRSAASGAGWPAGPAASAGDEAPWPGELSLPCWASTWWFQQL